VRKHGIADNANDGDGDKPFKPGFRGKKFLVDELKVKKDKDKEKNKKDESGKRSLIIT